MVRSKTRVSELIHAFLLATVGLTYYLIELPADRDSSHPLLSILPFPTPQPWALRPPNSLILIKKIEWHLR